MSCGPYNSSAWPCRLWYYFFCWFVYVQTQERLCQVRFRRAVAMFWHLGQSSGPNAAARRSRTSSHERWPQWHGHVSDLSGTSDIQQHWSWLSRATWLVSLLVILCSACNYLLFNPFYRHVHPLLLHSKSCQTDRHIKTGNHGLYMCTRMSFSSK